MRNEIFIRRSPSLITASALKGVIAVAVTTENMTNKLDTDVLIVGAGPVGLFLANECARRNLRSLIVEVHASQSEHSKALAIFPRTMEIFDMAGIVARSSMPPT